MCYHAMLYTMYMAYIVYDIGGLHVYNINIFISVYVNKIDQIYDT